MQNPKEAWQSFRCFSICHFSIFLEIPQEQISRGHCRSCCEEWARGAFLGDPHLPCDGKLSPWAGNLGADKCFVVSLHLSGSSLCILICLELLLDWNPHLSWGLILGLLPSPAPGILGSWASCTQEKPTHLGWQFQLLYFHANETICIFLCVLNTK